MAFQLFCKLRRTERRAVGRIVEEDEAAGGEEAVRIFEIAAAVVVIVVAVDIHKCQLSAGGKAAPFEVGKRLCGSPMCKKLIGHEAKAVGLVLRAEEAGVLQVALANEIGIGRAADGFVAAQHA